MRPRCVCALLLAGLGLLAGCDDRSQIARMETDDPDEMREGDVSGLNYTPYYIRTFRVTGHDNGIRGGGPSIQPARPDNIPTGGAASNCCATFPVKWRPGLKITVRWIANKKLDGIAWGSWYKAEAEVPEYGPATYGMWAIFLPGDRVKIMVMDGNANGHNSVRTRPADNDLYVAVGKVDEEANRAEEESSLRNYGEVMKADPSIGENVR